MKKILFILTAIICMAVTAKAQTVYVSNGSDAVAYHKSKSCSYLQNSKDIKSVSTAEAKKMGRHECQRCYGTATATKKATTAKKNVAKTEKKTTTIARDEKGRFIKKADTEKKAAKKVAKTEKKTTPARDEKGRFIKKADTKKADTKKAAEKKATPARDEKGRFIKKADTKKATSKKATKKAA